MKLTRIRGGVPYTPDGKTRIEQYLSNTGMCVVKSMNKRHKFGKLKHVEISHPDRFPGWDEIREIRSQFFGESQCVVLIPDNPPLKNYQTFYSIDIWELPKELRL